MPRVIKPAELYLEMKILPLKNYQLLNHSLGAQIYLKSKLYLLSNMGQRVQITPQHLFFLQTPSPTV